MGIRKRGAVWWIDFVAANGQRIRRSAETANKAQAQELHDRLRAEAWRLAKLGERRCWLWNDAVVRWVKEQAHRATAHEDLGKLRWLDPHLGGRELDAINRALIDRITEAKLAEGCSNATVNRTLALVRAILRKAVREWEWLDKAPAVRMLHEPARRIRFLTREQAARLVAELPAHLSDMTLFTLNTGLRAANVTGLRWDQIDLERKMAWVHPDQAKARKAIPVPLNESAMSVVSRQTGKHPTLVFSYRGSAVVQVSTCAWYKALQRAGISDFRFHDLRHTWASWHIQSGTPLFVLQEMGGWASESMVRRYAHLAADHLAPWAQHMSEGTFVVQSK